MTCCSLLALLSCCADALAEHDLRSATTPPAPVTISVDVVGTAPVLMGRSVQVAVQWRYAQTNGSVQPLEAYPFVNGSQWGASLVLARKDGPPAQTGSSTISLPIPHAGAAELVWLVLAAPLPGVTVGVPLASLPDTARVATSNPLVVAVKHRAITRLGNGADSKVDGLSKVQIGLQWEPLLASMGLPPGGGGAGFAQAEAVPLVGRYSAYDANVLKQHAIWLADSGVEWVNIDWTNNLWGCADWRQSPNCPSDGIWQEVINATSFAINGWQQLEAAGIPCPKAALMMGMMNGANASVAALNGQIDWVRHNYPKSAFVALDGLPLLMVFDGSGMHTSLPQQLNTSGFTLRWIAAALTTGSPALLSQGYWSWMDTTFPPAVTMRDGRPECTTISASFFRFGPGLQGWLTAPAQNTTRRGGATFLRSMLTAFAHRPKMLMIHQWNEFIGSPVGTTPPVAHKDFFGDEYNSTMSDDIEPTSLTECAGIRPGDSVCSGWGFKFLNLQRAFVSLLSGDYPDRADQTAQAPTLLTIATPTNRELVSIAAGRPVYVEWAVLGALADSFHVSLTTAAGAVMAERNVTAASAACPRAVPPPTVQDGKLRNLTFYTCFTTLVVVSASDIGGQAGQIAVTAEPLFTPFRLAVDQMDAFENAAWAPVTASVSVLLGPPFPAAPWEPPSKARILATGPLTTTAAGSPLCVYADANSTVGLRECASKDPSQVWHLMSNGEIHSVSTGRCLDAALGKLGRHVYTNGCVGNGIGQLWATEGKALQLKSSRTCVDGHDLLMAPCGIVGTTSGVWVFPTPSVSTVGHA